MASFDRLAEFACRGHRAKCLLTRHSRPAESRSQYISAHPEMMTRQAVNSYFDRIIWRLEKDEWDKLADEEKQEFLDALDAAKSNAPKGAFGRR